MCNANLKYGLISICETILNDSVKLPETVHNGYKIGPAKTGHSGDVLFYKNALPVTARDDLSFDGLL